jgi:hypothetical protein
MAFSFILSLIHGISVILAPVLIFNYDLEYVGTKFNRNDKINAYCIFHLAPKILMGLLFTSPDSLFLSKVNVDAVLRICIGLGSIKLIEIYGAGKVISVTRFFLGFALASTALQLSLPSLENNTLIKFAIGLIFAQITTLTPIAVVTLIILNMYSDIFYDAIVKLTQFNFFNLEICFTILVIFIGTCIVPRVPEEEFN